MESVVACCYCYLLGLTASLLECGVQYQRDSTIWFRRGFSWIPQFQRVDQFRKGDTLCFGMNDEQDARANIIRPADEANDEEEGIG